MSLKVGMSLLSQTPEQFTGTGLYVRELVRGLAELDGVELEALCNVTMAPVVRAWAAGPGLSVTAGDLRSGGRVGRVAKLLATRLPSGGRGAAFRHGPDVVHYPLTLPFPATRRPTVITLHDVRHRDHPEHFSRAERAWRRVAYDRASCHATLVITDSDHARHRIIEALRIAPERVVSVPLAVNHEVFRPLADDSAESSLETLGLPERFLFYPASLWRHKNHERLFQMLAQLDDQEIGLVLSGATFGRLDAVLAGARAAGVGHRVQHVGVIPDALLAPVYRAARALVYPSLYEGFGAPPLEAMACGVPVASSIEASLAEVCGDAVQVLDPRDSSQMAAAVDSLLADEALRTTLRERGLAQAARYCWSASVAAHRAAYHRAAGLHM